MQYWIMKSEPAEFSITDLERVGIEMWDGIRNYQVRNMFRDSFAVGDKALFYHSNAKEIGVVGEMEVVRSAYPDPTQFVTQNKHYDPKSDSDTPRWLAVDVSYVATFPRIVTLQELKTNPLLVELPLVQRGNRLSVMSVTKQQYDNIVAVAYAPQ